ncbi:MAG: hypothetical protein R3C19_02550 [Planctomycetaceae bacterium]
MPLVPHYKPPGPVRYCPSCGNQLSTVHEIHENICGDLKCRGPWLQRQIAKQKQKERDEQAALVDGARRKLREQFPDVLKQTESGDLRLIVVPGIDYDQAPQPPERIAAFRRTLEEHFAEAAQLAANPYHNGDLLSRYEPRDHDYDSRAVINACSTCRGWCCRMGHLHAYLLPEFLAWRLVNEPELTAEEMIDDYIDRIPEASQNDACLYQTNAGCAMPREKRSSTCNDFLCPGIREHRESIMPDPDQPTAVVSVDEGQFVRLGVMDAEGNRTEFRIA